MTGQLRIWVTAAGALACLAGCHRTTITNPLPIDDVASDPQQDLEFWHSLPGRSAVSNNEGFHGLILLEEGKDDSKNYEERLAYAREKQWVDTSFDEPGDLAMRRGTLAKAITVANDIQGGVMMHLTRKSPRYATFELVYMRIMGDGSPQMVLSGLDYVGVIGKVQDYVADRDARLAKAGVSMPVDSLPPGASPAGAAPAGEPAASPGAGTEPAPQPGAAPAAPANENPPSSGASDKPTSSGGDKPAN